MLHIAFRVRGKCVCNVYTYMIYINILQYASGLLAGHVAATQDVFRNVRETVNSSFDRTNERNVQKLRVPV